LTSRYEAAAALYRILSLHLGGVERLQKLADESQAKSVASSSESAVNLDPLVNRLGALEAGSLRLLVTEYEKELAGLGVDVDNLGTQISQLKRRLDILESAPQKIRISGDATLAVLGAIPSQGKAVMSSSGHVLGFDANGAVKGFERNAIVLHEFSLDFSGDLFDKASFNGRFSAGNALGTFRSLTGDVQGRLSKGPSELYIHSLNATLRGKHLRGETRATFGRFSHSVPLIFERVDNTPFWENGVWDSKGYLVDGFKLAMIWPGSELNFFGGRTASIKGVNGTGIASPVIRSFTTQVLESEALLGASLSLQANSAVSLRGGLIYMDGSRTIGVFPYSVNRMITLGGSMKIGLPGNALLEGGVAKNIYKESSRTTVDNRNETFFANLSVPAGSLRFEADYKRREHNSFLNGNWGQLGAVVNPTGYTSLKGILSMPMRFGSLQFSVEEAEGIDRERDRVGTAGLDRGDTLSSWSLGAEVRLSPQWQASLLYSDTQWNLKAGGDPKQKFLTLKARRGLGERAYFNIGLQLSETDSKNADFLRVQGLGGSFKGAVIFGQASMKF
jgi:hypothetical protein